MDIEKIDLKWNLIKGLVFLMGFAGVFYKLGVITNELQGWKGDTDRNMKDFKEWQCEAENRIVDLQRFKEMMVCTDPKQRMSTGKNNKNAK